MLGVQVFVSIELFDVERLDEFEAEAIIDSHGDRVRGKEADIAGGADFIDEFLNMAVHELRNQLAQSLPAEFANHVHESPETESRDAVGLAHVAVVRHETARSENGAITVAKACEFPPRHCRRCSRR